MGKKVTNRVKWITFRWAGALPRYTSNRYDSTEKVKKDTPMGLEVTRVARWVLKTAFTFSRRNPQYLKKPSSNRFTTTALIRAYFAPRGSFSSSFFSAMSRPEK